MENEENNIIENSYKWAKNKDNWGPIANEIIGEIPEGNNIPYAIFMAGSPGAGKTEFSRNFLHSADLDKYVVRIDPDQIRLKIHGYKSGISQLFQKATSKIVDKIYDKVLGSRRNFLLDGTFSNEAKAIENVKRVISRGYKIHINYVYQDPLVAWEFTKKREEVDGRNITKDDFIRELYDSRNVVDKIKAQYSDYITLDLIQRNIKTLKYDTEFNIKLLDGYIKEPYIKEELKSQLK